MKYLTLILLIFWSFSSFSQDNKDEIKTLFTGKIDIGGYGCPELKLTNFNQNLGLMVGGKGGWIIDHRLVLGGGGYGLTTRSRLNLPGHGDSTGNMSLGYGGVFLEYIAFPLKPVHFSIPLLLAGGNAEVYKDDGFFFDELIESSSFFVIEPGIDLEMNLLKFMRMSFGGSYRMVRGSYLDNVKDNDLSGVSFNLCLKFGYF